MDYLGAKSRFQWTAFVNTVMNSKKNREGIYPD